MADKFRRKKEPKHIRLYASITSSEAWKHLSGNAVKVLLALVARDDGSRNGSISLSVRGAAEAARISINTAQKCLSELQDLGFIRRTEKGAFSRKVSHASLWRYTWAAWPGGSPAAPTRDFEKWKPDEKTRYQKLTSAVPKIETPERRKAVTVAKIGTAPSEEPQNCVDDQNPNIGTHIINHRDKRSERVPQQPDQPPQEWVAPSPAIKAGWDGTPDEVLAWKIASGGKTGERWAALPREKALEKILGEQRR
jgi:hypothetical protein